MSHCVNKSVFSLYHLKIYTCVLAGMLALRRLTDADSLVLLTVLEELKQGRTEES